MQFDTSLLVPTIRRGRDLVVAAPGVLLVSWVGVAAFGLLSDMASRASDAMGTAAGLTYWAVLGAVDIWITRELLSAAGCRPVLSFSRIHLVWFQYLMVGIGMFLGLVLLVLPAFYIAARFYLSSATLILHGGSASEAMWRSWDMMKAHWCTALIIGLILSAAYVAQFVVSSYLPPAEGGLEFVFQLGMNLVAATGIIGGYVAGVALLLNVERPKNILQEIFG